MRHTRAHARERRPDHAPRLLHAGSLRACRPRGQPPPFLAAAAARRAQHHHALPITHAHGQLHGRAGEPRTWGVGCCQQRRYPRVHLAPHQIPHPNPRHPTTTTQPPCTCFWQGEVLYTSDKQALHAVRCAAGSPGIGAVTLHLYAPPVRGVRPPARLLQQRTTLVRLGPYASRASRPASVPGRPPRFAACVCTSLNSTA